ncbi:putative Casein kinase II subunit beta [Trypanosoma cruzi]|uniref:Casein kinase II subunit beta n=2 Tax=Trypanosoma cruzi TaxID=5693 RepID=Q4CUT6_TRYCC|nr:protein kinase ck2 regulatory subunit, putative [Trypanosoma cruzi]EAN84040.1 protein kinase ck2 regulatory subunit, putative [Trypanosoma cruzi]PWV04305.1 putative Casein kinase II subunit beta [Trypanosoma cruzi]RNC60626.1 protein kinase ck2 regulatory subunit [Trypanosoma cruzi]|eukprot:XP_805891.1 protein kinase ck2 regulatory subunit [Trypanosoma cruzi strain CL Brener]
MSYPTYTGVFSDDMAAYEDEADEEALPWIVWFCELKSHEFFCVVDREFIDDEFNLTGLSTMVSFYHYALDLILDLETQNSARLTAEQQRLVESSAETLYGLIHARFITTQRGLKLMEEKFAEGEFGRCPRVFCGGQAVLPVGQSDVVRESSVKLYCPKCQDIYYPRSSRHRTLDGAFWGTTFPHLFLMHLRENGKVIAKPKQHYVPRIYGFRLREKGNAKEEHDDEQIAARVETEETEERAAEVSVGESNTPANTPNNSRLARDCFRDPNGERAEAPQR